MESFIKILFLLFLPVFVKAQSSQSELDSLHLVVQLAKNDTIRLDVYKNLGSYYDDVNLDSAVYYFEKAINIAKQLQLKFTEADLYAYISFPLDKMGNYPRSLKLLNQALDIAGNPAYEKYIYNLSKGESPESYRLGLIGWIQESFASLYGYTGNYEKTIISANEAIRIAESFKNAAALADNISEKSYAYLKLNKPDSAIYFGKMALIYNEASSFHKFQANIYTEW